MLAVFVAQKEVCFVPDCQIFLVVMCLRIVSLVRTPIHPLGRLLFGRFVVLIVFQLVVADHYFLIRCPF